MDMLAQPPEVVTVTPNPAIDWTLTVPGFTASRVNLVEGQRSQPAGKGVNVAAALAEWGRRVAVTGFLGRDNSGHFEEFFTRRTIADHFVRIAGETRVGIKVVDPTTRQTTDLNLPGPPPGEESISLLRQRLERLAHEPSAWFVLAGSLPPGVPATLYRELLGILNARGCRSVLDASGDALRHGLQSAPSIVKPNIHELEGLVGRPLESTAAVIEAGRTLLAGGVALAAISMGADGALFLSGDEAVAARPPEVEIGSTVGAGDAMVAGIVAGCLAGLALPEIARLATGFSLHALTRHQADAPARERIESFAAQVEIDAPAR